MGNENPPIRENYNALNNSARGPTKEEHPTPAAGRRGRQTNAVAEKRAVFDVVERAAAKRDVGVRAYVQNGDGGHCEEPKRKDLSPLFKAGA